MLLQGRIVMRFLLSASVALATLISFDAYAQTCQKAPDCASLGYTKSASECSGRTYTVCPFDMTKYSCDTTTCEDMAYTDTVSECPGEYDVCQYDKTKGKCIYEARPGDLKYSWQVKNHNGWLLCKGGNFNKEQFPELYAVKGNNLIPNYKNYYLRGAAETTTSNFGTSRSATLPNITGSLWMVAESPYNGAFYSMAKGSALYDSGDKGGYGYDHTIGFDASQSNSTYGRADYAGTTGLVNPNHYLANIFIFAGKNKFPNAKDADITGKYVYSDGSTSTSYDSSKTLLGYGIGSNIYVWGGKDVAQGTSMTALYSYARSKCISQGGDLTTSYTNLYLYGKSIASNTVVGSIYTSGSTFYYIVVDYSSSATRPTSTSTSISVAYSSSHKYLYYCFAYYTPMNS